MSTMDELITRVLAGAAEPLEERRVARWRAETPENERRFGELARIWEATEPADARAGVPTAPTVEAVERRGAALRRRDARGRTGRRIRTRLVGPLAVAASVAAIALAVALGRDGPADALAVTEFVAGADESATVALSDGSFVRLGAGSSVRFAGDDDLREAWLRGRGFFGVAADPERPFVVHTDLGATRVLGTRFEVSTLGEELRVLVVEGRVAVTSTRGRSTELTSGQVARLSPGGDFSVTTVEDVLALLDWEGGVLVFQGTPLPRVAEEIGAHFGVPIEVAPELETRTLTAWFTDEPLRDVAESICLLLGADCDVSETRIRIETR